MAAAHAQTHHYPPSPPPSPSPPSARRRHNKKKPDPFEQLAATPIPSAPSSPAHEPDDTTEPLLTRIILTPVLFTSFLLSLFLVNYRNRARRAQEHAPPPSSLLAYLVPSQWLDPEPYQDPHDSTWSRRDAATATATATAAPHAEPHAAISPRPDAAPPAREKRRSWHLHKKVRKVARLEVGDALEMRGRVMFVMIAVMLLACAAGCMALKWFFVAVSHALSSSQA